MLCLPLPRSYPLLPPPGEILQHEIARVRRQVRRAISYNLPATLTIHEWLDTLNRCHWQCGLCGGPFESMEHIRPLGWGGGTTADNCIPACFNCNHTRHHISQAVVIIAKVRESDKWLLVQDLMAGVYR